MGDVNQLVTQLLGCPRYSFPVLHPTPDQSPAVQEKRPAVPVQEEEMSEGEMSEYEMSKYERFRRRRFPKRHFSRREQRHREWLEMREAQRLQRQATGVDQPAPQE